MNVSFRYLERQFLDSYLIEELDHFIELTRQDPNLIILRSKNWVVFKGDANNPKPELSFLSRFPQGIYDIEQLGHDYDVAIKNQNQARYTLIYDDTDFETLKHHLLEYLVMACLIILLLATWYGLWFSKKVIEPITSLAFKIKRIKPEHATGFLSDDYTDDEVGVLALEFDAYSRRLQALIQREREFTGNASHELRTPLSVIMAASEGLLAKQDIPDEVINKIERIDRSAKQMAERLETLLTMARHPLVHNETSDSTELASLIHQLVEDHRNLLAPLVKVVINVEGEPNINAPMPIVSMLIGNLIKNAFSYTDKGTVSIRLKEHEFEVTDTGSGIDKAELPQIFERGFKGASSRGSGLGLAISKRFCEYYGWKLMVESEKNKGTTVRWTFL